MNSFMASLWRVFPRTETRSARPAWAGTGLCFCLSLAMGACTATPQESFERGLQFEDGTGVPKDDGRAAELYTKACDGGHAQACARLGVLVSESRGVAWDEAREEALYTKACDGGYIQGCFDAGRVFEFGLRVRGPDKKRAQAFYTKACDKGHTDGCARLGFLFLGPLPMSPDRDEARAAALLTKACDNGHAEGCTSLGKLFQYGRGVSKDEARAATLYTKGCDGGVIVACFNLRPPDM